MNIDMVTFTFEEGEYTIAKYQLTYHHQTGAPIRLPNGTLVRAVWAEGTKTVFLLGFKRVETIDATIA